jgi:hypothetical protein
MADWSFLMLLFMNPEDWPSTSFTIRVTKSRPPRHLREIFEHVSAGISADESSFQSLPVHRNRRHRDTSSTRPRQWYMR